MRGGAVCVHGGGVHVCGSVCVCMDGALHSGVYICMAGVHVCMGGVHVHGRWAHVCMAGVHAYMGGVHVHSRGARVHRRDAVASLYAVVGASAHMLQLGIVSDWAPSSYQSLAQAL